MKDKFIVLLALVGLLVVLVVLSQALRTGYLIYVGSGIGSRTVAYEQAPKGARAAVLIVGDSTGLGVGASSPENSSAGLLGDTYRDVEMVNLAVNGHKTQDALVTLQTIEREFDLVIVHAGGNDVLRNTPLEETRANIDAIVKETRRVADAAIMIHGGDASSVLLLPIGTRAHYGDRSAEVRRMYQEVSEAESHVYYADVWQAFEELSKEEDFDLKALYAPDLIHPSDVSYQLWFEVIDALIVEHGLLDE